MKNTDPRVDAYVAKSAPFAKPILKHVRELVHAACPDVEETLKWSMPAFIYRGKIMCGMAAFKEHCTFGFWHQEMEEVVGPENSDTAMGSFGRLRSVEDLPSDRVMTRYIKKAVALNDSDVPARPRAPRAPSAPLPVPADLAAAIRKDKAAAASFEKLTPGQRKEYIEWITESKRDETRQKRLATAVEWLAEGKTRNWKYQPG